MVYLSGGLGIILLCGLGAWMVVDRAYRRGLVKQFETPSSLRWIAGLELVFLFWYFIESEGDVPLWLFLGSVALSMAAYGFEGFVKYYQRGELKHTPLFILDDQGNPVQFTKDKFTADVLPEIFKDTGSDPEMLRNMIEKAMADGLADQCVLPAQRLRLIDKDTERSTVLLADVYSLNERWDEMEKVLENYLENVGQSAPILFRLAWAYGRKGEAQQFEEFLWRGFEIDPNHTEGFKLLKPDYFEGMLDGFDYLALIGRVAEHPESWRAKFIQAEHLFRENETKAGLMLVEDAYPNCIDNPWGIYYLSELLSVFELYQETVDYIAPLFSIEIHGPATGINLALAYLKLEMKPEGLAVIEILRERDWPQREPEIASVERRLRALN